MKAAHDAGNAWNSGRPFKSELLGRDISTFEHQGTIILEEDLPQMKRRPEARLALECTAHLFLDIGVNFYVPCFHHLALPILSSCAEANAAER